MGLMTKQLAFIMLAIVLLSAVTVVSTFTVEQADAAIGTGTAPDSIKDKQRNTSLAGFGTASSSS